MQKLINVAAMPIIVPKYAEKLPVAGRPPFKVAGSVVRMGVGLEVDTGIINTLFDVGAKVGVVVCA